ncbi:hypothetical protein T07_540 [Trichinella nelsoni]|uniref:Uncharacterized protein n=1 Tax=Trichinella nelsoni TaxID=6336 RepID=A0A0V0RY71_9BILA|nr:hypothetical protein T07_540 [Trichinella nelsoni]
MRLSSLTNRTSLYIVSLLLSYFDPACLPTPLFLINRTNRSQLLPHQGAQSLMNSHSITLCVKKHVLTLFIEELEFGPQVDTQKMYHAGYVSVFNHIEIKTVALLVPSSALWIKNRYNMMRRRSFSMLPYVLGR